MKWSAVALAVVALLAFAPAAWGPPAVGESMVAVGSGCVTFGSDLPVSGNGFKPGTEVHVSAPIGTYTGPWGTFISDSSATADENGHFDANLDVPGGEPPSMWLFDPRTVFATGEPFFGGDPVERFTGVVLGTRAVCRILDPRPAMSFWRPRISTDRQTVRHPCFAGGRYDTQGGGQAITDVVPCEAQQPQPAPLRLRDGARVIVETPARVTAFDARFNGWSAVVSQLGFGGTVWEVRVPKLEGRKRLYLSLSYPGGASEWSVPVSAPR